MSRLTLLDASAAGMTMTAGFRTLIYGVVLMALAMAVVGSTMNLIQDAWRMRCPQVEFR